ncbi:structural cement protein Gp24 [Acetobacter sicerae]|uniref:structural cement protein Gp24 n=1 Tax=Acetobacter sicerae TaxID=85325 RepID=UPI00156B722D|nr:hypothetical protein [Acetobacter sicerae]NHN93433.1 hypothetical protein [Acetobacter sicerae]
MVSYLYRMDTSYAGDMTRQPAPGDIEQLALDPTVDWSTYGFGRPVVLTSDGKATLPTASTKSSDIYGMLVRAYPGFAVANTGNAAYPQINGEAYAVARRGFMAVPLQGSTSAAKGSSVYVRVGGVTSPSVLGAAEAAADATTASNTPALTGAKFVGPAGTDGITEISFDFRAS